MSIKGALLGLLSEGPMTGYEIAKRFEHSLARVWPARSNQIYTELNRLEAEGLIEEVERGARGARRYAIVPAGRAWARDWLLTRSPPEQQLRFEGLLKANFVSLLPQAERRAHLKAERAFWREQEAWLRAQMKHLPPDDAPTTQARRAAAEAGLKLYAAMAEWADGALQEG